MKIKFSKHKVNEVIGTVTAVAVMGAILVLALAAIYKTLGPILKKGDDKLKEADEKIREGAEELPAEAKEDFMQKYNDAIKSLKQKATELQTASKTKDGIARLGGRPSTIIANEIKKVVIIVQEVIKKYPDVKETFDGADRDLIDVYNSVSSLDYLILFSSKTEPNGLFVKVISKGGSSGMDKLKEKLADTAQLFTFGELLAVARSPSSRLPAFDMEAAKSGARDTAEEPPAETAEEEPTTEA